MTSSEPNRPDVLGSASETQIEELERQFQEEDRTAWDALTASYGWSSDDSTAVWEWFGLRPNEGTG
jgi:hypothetical protein